MCSKNKQENIYLDEKQKKQLLSEGTEGTESGLNFLSERSTFLFCWLEESAIVKIEFKVYLFHWSTSMDVSKSLLLSIYAAMMRFSMEHIPHLLGVDLVSGSGKKTLGANLSE